jgi:hypothetical protein
MEDHVAGERAYPERRRFARRPRIRDPERPSVRAGGLRVDALTGRGFPGIRIRHGRPPVDGVAAIPARPTGDRTPGSTPLDSPRRDHVHGHMPGRPCSRRTHRISSDGRGAAGSRARAPIVPDRAFEPMTLTSGARASPRTNRGGTSCNTRPRPPDSPSPDDRSASRSCRRNTCSSAHSIRT